MAHISQFRALWAQLHNRPLHSQLSTLNSQLEAEWLAQFANRIPCAHCRRHWLEVIAKLPPPFADLGPPSSDLRRSYFAWTVRAHNSVNRLLGKPVISLRAARKLWNYR